VKNLKARKGMAALVTIALVGSTMALAPSAAYAADKGSDQTPKNASMAKVQRAKTKISKLSSDQKSITVKWKKLSSSKADGYQVRYAANSTFKKAKTVKVKKASTVKAVLKKGVKPFITYYVQVRAYKKVGKKTVYSQWSATKTATTKAKANTGDKKLDKKINSILDKKIKKTGDAGLKKAFDYVAKLPYGTKGATKPKGKWAVTGAKKMISNKGGNCYESAALFCQLAKAMGYNAKAMAGKTSGRPHGWVEIKVSGTWYVCDPNNTTTLLKSPNSKIAKQIVEEKGLALDSCLFMQPKSDTLFVYSK